MQAQDQQIDGLQQKASAHYLQGEFDQALRAWRQVLLLDPDNEKALEGVRLCEMLEDANEDPPSDEAATTPDPGPADTLDDLDDLLDARVGGSVQAPVVSERGPDLPEIVDSPAENEPDTATQSQAAAPVADLDFDFTDLEEGPDSSAPSTDATSEAELRLRAVELLNEAQQAYDLGNKDDALGLLTRLFILDETHPAALELQARIRAETEAPAATPEAEHETPQAAPTATDGLSLDLDEPSAAEGAAGHAGMELVGYDHVEPVSAAPGADGGASDDDPGEPFGEDGVVEDESADGDEDLPPLETIEETELKPLAKASGSGKKKLVIAACTVVVVAAAVFAGLEYLGGEPAPERPTEEEIIASLGLPSAAPEEPPADGPPDEELAAAQAAAAEERLRAINDALGRGTAAMASGEFAAAVVAYNDVIGLDPENTTAKKQLVVAGEKYREQKQILEQWESAIRYFNEENYRAALAAFYRLPDDQDEERLALYRRNGWYNMALQALISGNCGDAVSHFGEARSIDAQDAGVSAGAGLAARCRDEAATVNYRRSLEAMTYRGIED